MNVKDVISKLLVLKNSATFLSIAILSFTNCNQIQAQEETPGRQFLYMGPPTSTSSTSGGGSSGTTK